jgi:hypothetical protein
VPSKQAYGQIGQYGKHRLGNSFAAWECILGGQQGYEFISTRSRDDHACFQAVLWISTGRTGQGKSRRHYLSL